MRNAKAWAKIILVSLGAIAIFSNSMAGERIMLSISYGYLFPADSGYRDIYGKNAMLPEFNLGFRIVSDLYVYGSYFSLSRNGVTPELQEPASSRQTFIGGGVAYFPSLGKHLKVYAGAGVVSANYKEEAMGVTVKGNKLGTMADVGIYFRERYVFIGLHGGYYAASDTYEGNNFKLGGARAAVVLGFIF
jgi:hypothetical protein